MSTERTRGTCLFLRRHVHTFLPERLTEPTQQSPPGRPPTPDLRPQNLCVQAAPLSSQLGTPGREADSASGFLGDLRPLRVDVALCGWVSGP